MYVLTDKEFVMAGGATIDNIINNNQHSARIKNITYKIKCRQAANSTLNNDGFLNSTLINNPLTHRQYLTQSILFLKSEWINNVYVL